MVEILLDLHVTAGHGALPVAADRHELHLVRDVDLPAVTRPANQATRQRGVDSGVDGAAACGAVAPVCAVGQCAAVASGGVVVGSEQQTGAQTEGRTPDEVGHEHEHARHEAHHHQVLATVVLADLLRYPPDSGGEGG